MPRLRVYLGGTSAHADTRETRETLLLMVKHWKRPKYPSVVGWISGGHPTTGDHTAVRATSHSSAQQSRERDVEREKQAAEGHRRRLPIVHTGAQLSMLVRISDICNRTVPKSRERLTQDSGRVSTVSGRDGRDQGFKRNDLTFCFNWMVGTLVFTIYHLYLTCILQTQSVI